MTARIRRGRLAPLLGAASLALAVGLTGQPGYAAPDTAPSTSAIGQPSPLAAALATAAARYDVPRDLLAALGQAETRLDGHAGAPSASGGYGVMHLTSNPTVRSLDEAARLTGLDRAVLRTDSAANVVGAAAVLRSYADDAGLTATQRADLASWYAPVVRYGGATDPRVARLYGDAVYDLLGAGFSSPAGVVVAGRPVAPRRGPLAGVPAVGSADRASGDVGTMSTDYGPAAWVPAYSGNYTVASRPPSTGSTTWSSTSPRAPTPARSAGTRTRPPG
ncbi:hypothetical protein [Plantactinospora sp. BC1]|uniref:hypothetical protein n=1 Tax=Plantactinospora sp. BC1 TaxID=2108470 RepID=UPI0018FEE32F|nr:hypothetical protein [Plantactinospora sp. BC1]